MRFLLLILSFLTISMASVVGQNKDVLEKLQGVDLNNPLVKSELNKMGVSPEEIKGLKNQGSKVPEQKSNKTISGEKNITQINVATVKPDSVLKKDDKLIKENIVFGHHIFQNKFGTYLTSKSVKANDNYQIGEGDEFLINIWGYSELNASYRVAGDGAINAAEIGKIYLKGLTFIEAKRMLRSKLSKVYDLKNSKLKIELIFSRTINVNIVGEVNVPGTYAVNASNSAFNCLFLAGGITDIGSLRDIAVIRDGKRISTVDIYEFLINPSKFNHTYLQEGDYIVVPTRNKIVEIGGAVIRSGKYEIKEKESLKELLVFSGGFEARAVSNLLHVERVDSNELSLLEINIDDLENGSSGFELEPGDKVYVTSIESKVYGYVQVKGAIKIPGRFSIELGDKVRDVILKAGGVKEESIGVRAYVIRTNHNLSKEHIPFNLKSALDNENSKDNIELKSFDELLIFDKSEFNDEMYITVSGSVRNPDQISFGKGLSLKDAIILCGGFKAEAANNKIEISRVSNFKKDKPSDLPTVVENITIDVNEDLELNANDQLMELRPFDHIFVRKTPDFELQQLVQIRGEVSYPGGYALLNKNERLTDLIDRSGGFTDWAFLEGATIERTEDSIGFIVLDLWALTNKKRDEFNYVLRAGDIITIPKISNLVSLTGAIDYPLDKKTKVIHAPFQSSKRAKYFINKFGRGFNKGARRNSVYTLNSGGLIKRTKNLLFFKLYPKVTVGDKIVVEYKDSKEKKNSELVPIDWNNVIESTTIKITGVLTLWVLIKNVAN